MTDNNIKKYPLNLKLKDLVFLPTHERQKRNALAHLHIWLPAHAQNQHSKVAKRANLSPAYFLDLFYIGVNLKIL